MKIGLVLEGGGMRGLCTAGVLDVMMEHQFMPDVVCGTSAGVTFGVNLLSQQKGRVLRYNCRYAGDRRYISLYSWLARSDFAVSTKLLITEFRFCGFTFPSFRIVIEPYKNKYNKNSHLQNIGCSQVNNPIILRISYVYPTYIVRN